VTVAEANANNRQDAVRECQTLWLLNGEGYLSRPCAALVRSNGPFARNAEALERGTPRLFRPMYAPRQAGAGRANMGHPSREGGWVLQLDACGKLKGSGSAGAEETACRADSRVKIGLHGLCGLAILCRLVGTDGIVAPRIVSIARPTNIGFVEHVKAFPDQAERGTLAQAEVLLQPQIERTERTREIDTLRTEKFERLRASASKVLRSFY